MTQEELKLRVNRVRRELEEASEGRWPAPKLIAVTKTHSAEGILPLKEIGITEIGENRVQELRAKLPELLQIIERDPISEEMQERIFQRRAVTRR